MNKLYNIPINQYSLKGELINTFKEPKDALSYCSYDSIIACCKGKSKTAGGYVWKFKGDKFDYLDRKKGDHQCLICSSFESIRGMAMHLKWVHNLTTSEYVNKFGEFRPKYLKEIKLRNKSNIKCGECGEKLRSNQHLMHHINTSHPDITQSEYVIKHMYKGNPPLCKCGCGEEVTLLLNGKNCDLDKETYNRDYIKGHWDWEVFSNIPNQSKEELELCEFIKSIYKGEFQESVRGIIPKYELDIFLPQLNLAIEYNGLYWHSEKAGRMRDYHINKTQLCMERGIRLIQIFSDEWENNKNIVKQKLKSILNFPTERIYARKCKIKEISPQKKNHFLNKHHIQGEDRSSIKLGIFFEEMLVGVMTFSKPRVSLGGNSKNQNSYELSRYATSSNLIGGASKLISYFIKKFNPSHIYSYSDNRWTDPNNNMYLKIGFTKTKTSSPGYWYTKDYIKRLHRYNFNKFKLGKMGADVKNKTEKVIMEEMGYTRVWDCGTTKYEMFI